MAGLSDSIISSTSSSVTRLPAVGREREREHYTTVLWLYYSYKIDRVLTVFELPLYPLFAFLSVVFLHLIVFTHHLMEPTRES